MKIAYVLSHPELCGGVKVVFQHARLLQNQGHEVTVLGYGPKPDWYGFSTNYVDYSEKKPDLVRQDLVIATYFTTVAIAESLNLGPVAHFCQGYEGDLVHLTNELPQIEAAYSRPMPTLVVAPHLAQLVMQQFGRQSRVVSPPIDSSFRPSFRFSPRENPWIFIPGIFEAEVKGVRTALEAVNQLRAAGLSCRVVRCSTLPLTEDERKILEPDRYLFQVPVKDVAHHLCQCDLMLFPSLSMEGFGLPLLEAMVSKVPAIASSIPAVQFMAGEDLTLVRPGDAVAFAAEAARLLNHRHLWRKARSGGYRAARKFHPRVIARQLSEAIHWARETAS